MAWRSVRPCAQKFAQLGLGSAAVCAAYQLRPRRPPAAEGRDPSSPAAVSSCVILGGGIIGLSTAYFLAKAGTYDEIHIVDQREDCGRGCSFQNGGVINVEAIAPVNSYMSIFATLKGSLLHSLTGASTNTLVTWRALLEPPDMLLRWCWYFWKNTDEVSILRNATKMRELGRVTGPLFEEVAADLGLGVKSCNFGRTPGLVLFKAAEPEATVEAKQARFGSVQRKQYVTGQALDAVMQDSALVGLSAGYNVGCVEPDNLTINTFSFCKRLRAYLERCGVRFHLNAKVSDVVIEGSRVKSLVLESGDKLEAATVILCAGYETCYIARRLGISLPLAPVKAYSLHISNSAVAARLKYATHVESKVACLITPYRDSEPPAVRVTGIRDLDGFNDSAREDRLAALTESARTFLGDDFRDEDVQTWAGVMAVSPDDFPVVGRVQKFDNLFLNVGHGFRGTNWSVATAKLLSQIIRGDSETCFDAESTSPSRFGL